MYLHGSGSLLRGIRPISVLLLSFIFSVSSAAAAAGPAASCSGHPPSLIGPKEFADVAYDYLIVGGGTAGLALASRLSEDENTKVGVIEAGQFHPDDPLLDVPGFFGRAAGNATYDWQFVTVPQPQAAGRAITMPRGKVLGGSSALNLLAWTRASTPEYDAWRDFAQSSAWSWDGLLPYMKKTASVFLPNQTGPGIPDVSRAAFDPAFEGFDGPVPVSFNTWCADPFPVYLDTLNTLGIATNFNPDSGTTAGSTNSRSDVDRAQGTRSYAAPTYFCRAAARPNLHVVTGAQATKVVLVPSTSGGNGGGNQTTAAAAAYKATGVEYSSGSASYTARAKREVILSAGVYQSPQLLELSGIGNKTLLEKVGIKSLVDLPGVGENLQDHLFVFVQYKLKPGFVTFDTLRTNSTFAAEQTALYQANRTGILAATHSALAFLPLHAFLDERAAQALLAAFDRGVAAQDTAAGAHAGTLAEQQYAVQRAWLAQGEVPQLELLMWSQGLVGLDDNSTYITVFPGGLHHLNRGSVHINTSMPLARPVIDPAWLTNDYDVMLLLEGLKLARRIGTAQPLANIVEAVTSPPPDLQTDDALIGYIRQVVTSAQHPMGSAAMGPRELGGVVDASLVVHGTANLRICDASVFPVGIGTHLQETVYAIAEKLADDIRNAKH